MMWRLILLVLYLVSAFALADFASTSTGNAKLSGEYSRGERYLVAECGGTRTLDWPLNIPSTRGGKFLDAVTKPGGGASVVNAMPHEPSLLWRIAYCDSVQPIHRKHITGQTNEGHSTNKFRTHSARLDKHSGTASHLRKHQNITAL